MANILLLYIGYIYIYLILYILYIVYYYIIYSILQYIQYLHYINIIYYIYSIGYISYIQDIYIIIYRIYIYIVYVYIYHIFFIHSSVDGHLGCFHVLAIVNSAAMNIGVYVSFQIRVFVFSGYMPRSGGIAGSYCSSIFSFFQEPPYCSSQWLHQFTFSPTVQEGFLSSTPSLAFIICRFLMMAILTGMR